MVHTAEDYSDDYLQPNIYGFSDNAELAARISKYFSVDRRGSLVWSDDFESAAALHWAITIDTIGTCTLSNIKSFTGNASMKLVTAAVIGDSINVRKQFSGTFSHRSGAELWFNFTTGEPFVYLYIMGYNGTNYYFAELRVDAHSNTAHYFDNTGALVPLTLVDRISEDNEHWIPLKFVVDWDLLEYVRIIIGGTVYDMKGIGLWNVASAHRIHIDTGFDVEAKTAAVATVYVDNFILTCNE